MLLQQLCISFNHSLLSLFSLLPFSLTHSISQSLSLSLSLSLIPSYFLSLLFHFSSLAIDMGQFAWRLKWVVCSLAQVVLLRLVEVMAGGMVISLRSIEVVAGCQALVQWWVVVWGLWVVGFCMLWVVVQWCWCRLCYSGSVGLAVVAWVFKIGLLALVSYGFCGCGCKGLFLGVPTQFLQ